MPEVKVRSRYTRLSGHLAAAIGLTHEAFVYDNSRAGSPFRRMATFSHGRPVGPSDWPEWSPDGARLVYLGKTGASGATQRQQDPLTAEARDEWRELVRQASAMRAPHPRSSCRNSAPPVNER